MPDTAIRDYLKALNRKGYVPGQTPNPQTSGWPRALARRSYVDDAQKRGGCGAMLSGAARML